MAFIKISNTADLPEDSLTEVLHAGRLYALCNVAGEIRVLHGTCPHHGGPLGQGALEAGLVTCPWHAWQFDSATGKCEFFDTLSIPVYPVRLEGGAILADLPDA